MKRFFAKKDALTPWRDDAQAPQPEYLAGQLPPPADIPHGQQTYEAPGLPRYDSAERRRLASQQQPRSSRAMPVDFETPLYGAAAPYPVYAEEHSEPPQHHFHALAARSHARGASQALPPGAPMGPPPPLRRRASGSEGCSSSLGRRDGVRERRRVQEQQQAYAPPDAAEGEQQQQQQQQPGLGRWRSLRDNRNGEAGAPPRPQAHAYPSYEPSDGELETFEAQGGERRSKSREPPGGVTSPALAGEKPRFKLFGKSKGAKEKADKGEALPQGSSYGAAGDSQQDGADVAWFDMRGKGPQKGEGAIANKIGWLCGTPMSSWDWAYLLQLADTISRSEAAAREAAKALKKELKHADAEPRKRAIKVWAVLTLNGSDRFKMQIVEKSFLKTIEEILASTKTPYAIKEVLMDTYGMLAFEFQDDDDLHALTKSYNKIRPSDRPLNGTPLDPTHEIFSPVPTTPAAALAYTKARSRRPHDAFADAKHSAHKGVLPMDEDMRRLHEECVVARSSAQMLFETLAETGMESSLLSEFASKTQTHLDFLASQIPWATAQADRSRETLREERMRATAEGATLTHVQETKEEALLADLLDAHERLVEARSMLEQAHARQFDEDDDEQRAIERSRAEVRFDRSTLQQDPNTGELYSLEAPPSRANWSQEAGGSGRSRPSSPSSFARGALPTPAGGRPPPAGAGGAIPASLLAGGRGPSPANLHSRDLSVSSKASSRGLAASVAPSTGPPSEATRPASSLSQTPGAPTLQAAPLGGRPLPTPGVVPGAMNGSGTLPATSPQQPQHAPSLVSPPSKPVPPPLHVAPATTPQPLPSAAKDDDGDSIIMTPVRPSAKALGKRRQVSSSETDSSINSAALARASQQLSMQDDANDMTASLPELRVRPPPPVPDERAATRGPSPAAPSPWDDDAAAFDTTATPPPLPPHPAVKPPLPPRV